MLTPHEPDVFAGELDAAPFSEARRTDWIVEVVAAVVVATTWLLLLV